MRYSVADIEDQIIATLQADAAFAGVNVNTHAGVVNDRIFSDPAMLEGFIPLLPFVFIQYIGRQQLKSDDPRLVYFHSVTFRLYVGAKSLRQRKDAQRGAYAMLAEAYDDLHGKLPLASVTSARPNPKLSGNSITTSDFNPLSPLMEAGGLDEVMIINMPQIVVYRTDYKINLVA